MIDGYGSRTGVPGLEASCRARPTLYVGPVPHKPHLQAGDRLGELRVAAPPVVNGLRQLHREPLSDFGRPHKLVHVHPAPHRERR